MSFRLPSADGYVFDFNGTLFWDTEENREAWDAAALEARGRKLSDDEFLSLNGRTDEETAIYLLPDAAEDERQKLILCKERLYKEICISHSPVLSPGSEDLLSALKARGRRMAIASSAPWMNMEWYIPCFRLERFFPPGMVIAGRTDIPSKPDPAIFRLAMSTLGTEPERTVIFEDSASGVKAALASGAALVIRVREAGAESIRDPRVVEVPDLSAITAEGL